MKTKAQREPKAESHKPSASLSKLSASPKGLSRLRLDLAFVGTGFCGWQSQVKGTTVQGLLDVALQAIGHRGSRAVGCSRTDSGVHARLFTAHVDTGLERPLSAVLNGLNANLPPQVRIYRASRAPQGFHARYASTLKRYRYHLYRGKVIPPAVEPFVWAWRGELVEESLREAAALFPGEHDFAALTTADGRERNTLRTISECRWEERGPLFVLHVAGPSFLHRMVRCMGGAMIAAGTGRMTIPEIRSALAAKPGGPQIPALPAQGLTLWDVEYGGFPDPADGAGEIPESLLFPL